MKNKKGLIIVVIIIAILSVIGLIIYKSRESIPVSSNISEGMEVTLLGGSNMKENGDVNSMRLCY